MLVKIKLGLFLLLICIITLFAACDGGDDRHGDNGPMPGGQTRQVTGVVSEGTARHFYPGTNKTIFLAMNLYELISSHSAYATGQVGTFIVSAVGRDSSIHETDTDPVTGGFTLHLPDEFWDFMVFQCAPQHMGDFDDQFCLTSGNHPVDLGMITLHSDHGFAMAMHNPLEEVDTNGDGTMDFHDPDYICGNVEDANHDGYYDDDFDHDGFHDDDMDHDGFHDGMQPGHGMGPGGGMMHR